MSNERPQRDRDPLAELARLIAHADTDSAPSNRFGLGTDPSGDDEAPELPPAPQLADDGGASERNEYPSDDQADIELYEAAEEYPDSEVPHYAGEEFQDGYVPHSLSNEELGDYEARRTRRRSLTLVMATLGVSLIGSACAVGYRDIFGGITSQGVLPTNHLINERRIGPTSNEAQAKASGNARQIGVATTGSIDNSAPAAIAPATARPDSPPATGEPATARVDQAVPKQTVSRVVVHAAAPSAVRTTMAPGLGQSAGATTTAPPSHEHLPTAHVAVTTTVGASRYTVQVTSEHSESRAQASFRALQAKYPDQLSGYQPMITRADLGAAGIYYRALIGPFASAQKATKLCNTLKAAGGDCIIQKTQ